MLEVIVCVVIYKHEHVWSPGLCIVLCMRSSHMFYSHNLVDNLCLHYLCCILFAAVFSGRLLRVDLIKWVSNVRPPIHTSVHPQKSFFDFNDIWYVGRGRRVIHDGMQHDPIQGQGHEPLKVRNSDIFNGSPPPIYNGSGKWPRILKLGGLLKAYQGWIFDFCPSFCVTWLWSWQ